MNNLTEHLIQEYLSKIILKLASKKLLQANAKDSRIEITIGNWYLMYLDVKFFPKKI